MSQAQQASAGSTTGSPVALGSLLFAIAVTHSLLQAFFDYDTINPETSDGEVNEV